MEYVYKNNRRLRCGYTTGSCAAAAAKAAAYMLLTGETISEITIDTPKGVSLTLSLYDCAHSAKAASCAVKKDAGDDADVTDGMLIYATVSLCGAAITIDGGAGIGRVTKPGLEQPVGCAAINRTPRQMIQSEVARVMADAGCEGGMHIVISAPAGAALSEKTFNPRLGIVGGISILGTTGIVEPMSEQALLATIRLELRQKRLSGCPVLLLSPGNYGQQFLQNLYRLDLEKSVKCSNFIGETLDMAVTLGFPRLLLVGHIGKLIKLASGIMNTHSKMADARMETLCACALAAGCDADTARALLSCTTTDDALSLLTKTPYFDGAMQQMTARILYHMRRRTEGKIQSEVLVFSNVYGVLGMSEHVMELIASI